MLNLGGRIEEDELDDEREKHLECPAKCCGGEEGEGKINDESIRIATGEGRQADQNPGGKKYRRFRRKATHS